jgi:GNAT superfamily N-acetyltransferase
MDPRVDIRDARREELEQLGRLMVSVYSSLEGFPTPHEQPAYYAMLANIGALGERPGARLIVAELAGRLVGGVVYFADMAHYGSGGIAARQHDASGFRLLAVDPAARGVGVGKALVERCLDLATASTATHVIIHTTSAMKTAWAMYERMGFIRSPELDFMQESLPVFGFRREVRR